jgi:hypothetical protein
MKNNKLYLQIYEKLREAREKDTYYGISKNLIKKNTENIRKALLDFLRELENLIKSPNLKYSDISLFYIDSKFLFPQKNVNLSLEKGGPVLIISTKGLLYELFKAIDLEKHFSLIIKLQKSISNLNETLSEGRKKEAIKYKEKTFKIIKEIKNILA